MTADWIPETWRGRSRLALYRNMLLKDHCLVRLPVPNAARVCEGVYRAGQPLPIHLARWARRGIRTVVNLRGQTKFSTYVLEREACERLGMTYVDLPLESRKAPEKERIRRLLALFRSMEKPVLFHCKSGSDRTGLVAALYLLLVEGRRPEEAMRAFSLRYLHIRQGRAGVLSRFLAEYLVAARRGMSFETWLDEVYDPAKTNAAFRARRWAALLTDEVLRRE